MINLFLSLKIKTQLFIQLLISKFRKKIIGKNVIALLNETANGLFLIDPQDYTIGKLLAERGAYESGNLNTILRRLSAESRVCIIGAHVGIFLIPIAKKVKYVFAVEANPYTYNLLQLNLKINDVNNAQLFNYAAGNEEKMIDFYVSHHNTGGSKIKPEQAHFEFSYDNPEIKKVKMVRIDDICENPDFDMVIMDIEGSEYYALLGMSKILSHCKYLHIEFVPNHLRKIGRVTNKQFLETFQNYFSEAKIMYDKDNYTYKKEEFLQMLEKIERESSAYSGKDILFIKNVSSNCGGK